MGNCAKKMVEFLGEVLTIVVFRQNDINFTTLTFVREKN